MGSNDDRAEIRLQGLALVLLAQAKPSLNGISTAFTRPNPNDFFHGE